MKRFAVICVFSVGLSVVPVRAQNPNLQHGTIVRMRMAECMAPQHGWMAAMSGSSRAATEDLCPEYVLVTDKVVYLIVGKSSEQLIPLVDSTKFRLRNNELLIRVDDAPKESRFRIKEMMLRSEWDRVHRRMEEDDQPAHENSDSASLSIPR